MLKLRWKVDNPDGDDLNYRLAFREENEAVWRPLGGPDSAAKPSTTGTPRRCPTATTPCASSTSDERAQPRERGARVDASSRRPLLVDNRKPEVVGLEPRTTRRRPAARATTSSPITEIEFAVDGGDWQLVPPSDGIFDDCVEAFSFRLPALPRRARTR